MNHLADIINVVIEELIRHYYELPPFEQANRLVNHAHALANRQIFQKIFHQLDDSALKMLDDLLIIKLGFNKTGYNSLKRLPKNPTISHFKELLVHHDWLLSFGNAQKFVCDISKTKLQQFSVEAKWGPADEAPKMLNLSKTAIPGLQASLQPCSFAGEYCTPPPNCLILKY